MRTLRGWPRHCVQQGRALSHCCVVFRGMPTPLLGTESGTVSVCVCVCVGRCQPATGRVGYG